MPEYYTAKLYDLLNAVPKDKWRQHKQHSRVAVGSLKVCKSSWLQLERLIEDGTPNASGIWAGNNMFLAIYETRACLLVWKSRTLELSESGNCMKITLGM